MKGEEKMTKNLDNNPDMKRLMEWLQIKLVDLDPKERWLAFAEVNDYIRVTLGYGKEWKPPEFLFV